MKRKNLFFYSLIVAIVATTLIFKVSTHNMIELTQNIEVLIDGEATILSDCHLKGSFNSEVFMTVCEELTSDYLVYPCLHFDNATIIVKKCKTN